MICCVYNSLTFLVSSSRANISQRTNVAASHVSEVHRTCVERERLSRREIGARKKLCACFLRSLGRPDHHRVNVGGELLICE